MENAAIDVSRLRRIRRKHGKTLQQLAEETKVSKSHLSQIETGKRQPSYALAIRIAEAFSTTPDKIFLPAELTNSERKGADSTFEK
jgi:putative transcriptional regulator